MVLGLRKHWTEDKRCHIFVKQWTKGVEFAAEISLKECMPWLQPADLWRSLHRQGWAEMAACLLSLEAQGW